jgi:hypothetical protein
VGLSLACKYKTGGRDCATRVGFHMFIGQGKEPTLRVGV